MVVIERISKTFQTGTVTVDLALIGKYVRLSMPFGTRELAVYVYACKKVRLHRVWIEYVAESASAAALKPLCCVWRRNLADH